MATLLAPPAHLVETDRRKRADQGETRGEREQQRQHSIAKRQPSKHKTNQGIDNAEKDDVGTVSREVIKASGQNIRKIGYPDPPDFRPRWLQFLFNPDPGAARRSDDRARKLDLIGCPLDGVPDRHVCLSRTAGPRAAGHSWQHTRSGLWSPESRDPPLTKKFYAR